MPFRVLELLAMRFSSWLGKLDHRVFSTWSFLQYHTAIDVQKNIWAQTFKVSKTLKVSSWNDFSEKLYIPNSFCPSSVTHTATLQPPPIECGLRSFDVNRFFGRVGNIDVQKNNGHKPDRFPKPGRNSV